LANGISPKGKQAGFIGLRSRQSAYHSLKMERWLLPIPATFVVGTDDEVKAALSIPIIAGGWRSRI
jgi:hypothetical protein